MASRLRRISGRVMREKLPKSPWPYGNVWNGQPVGLSTWPFAKQPWKRVK